VAGCAALVQAPGVEHVTSTWTTLGWVAGYWGGSGGGMWWKPRQVHTQRAVTIEIPPTVMHPVGV